MYRSNMCISAITTHKRLSSNNTSDFHPIPLYSLTSHGFLVNTVFYAFHLTTFPWRKWMNTKFVSIFNEHTMFWFVFPVCFACSLKLETKPQFQPVLFKIGLRTCLIDVRTCLFFSKLVLLHSGSLETNQLRCSYSPKRKDSRL